MLPELWHEATVLVVYDLRLRDSEAVKQGQAGRRRWGEEYTDVYSIGLDHVILSPRPGGNAETAA
jgi:hypothetical protein